MAESKNGNWKNVFYSRWFLLVLFGLAVLLIFSYIRAYYQEYKVRSEINTLHEEVGNLEAKKLETMEIFKHVQSQAFVEEKARTELNLLKPGEKMAVIPSGSSKNDIGQPEPNLVKWSNVKNPIKWFKFFFFKNNN
ncbi:MAG: septum formation initiator family protein [Candidatus Magasanikbacteria bacterium]